MLILQLQHFPHYGMNLSSQNCILNVSLNWNVWLKCQLWKCPLTFYTHFCHTILASTGVIFNFVSLVGVSKLDQSSVFHQAFDFCTKIYMENIFNGSANFLFDMLRRDPSFDFLCFQMHYESFCQTPALHVNDIFYLHSKKKNPCMAIINHSHL